jgi:uncharacterized protein (TIGR00730 family)
MNKKVRRPEKAYHNKRFLNSPDARPIRILAEYVEPLERFEEFQVDDTILVFGSARIVSREAAEAAVKEAGRNGGALNGNLAQAKRQLEMSRYYEDTRALARRLTEWSKGIGEGGRRFVICTGGGPGIMEAANRGASEAKGENIGLGISLKSGEPANSYITHRLNFEFHYFFMRKFWFLYLAKAAIIMPGGFGTFDELMELLTLIQTEKVRKKLPIVLYGGEFWDKVIDFEAMVDCGVIAPHDPELFHRSDSVDDALEFITAELEKSGLAEPGGSL